VLLRLPDLPLPGFPMQDRLRIFMHPHQLVLLRIKRGNAQHIISKQVVACHAGEPGTSKAEASWMPAVSTLATVLRDKSWHGAKPQLVLANHFVRYALIPWHDSLGNHAERQAYLRHSFQLAYGDSAKGWDLRMSDNGVQRAAVASGIEQSLLQHVQQAFEAAGLSTSEIYPHLMVAINQVRQQTDHAAYWFALVESGRLCISLIQNGHWRSVKTCAAAEDIAGQIADLIERESVICGINTTGWPLLMYWPGHVAGSEMQISNRQLPNRPPLNRQVEWIRPLNLGRLEADVLSGDRLDAINQLAGASSSLELAMWA